MARFALLLLALAACNDSLDELDRAATGDAVGTAVASVQIYAGVFQLGTATPSALVTGTRESFDIDGATASPWSGTVERSGTGKVRGVHLDMQVIADLVAWHDEFWDVTLNGQVEVLESATFADTSDPFPSTVVQQITGELDVSGRVEGTYSFDLTICRRGDGELYDVYGLRGTVDGEEAEDQIQGFTSSCLAKN